MSIETATQDQYVKPVDPFVINSYPPADNILTDAKPAYEPMHAAKDEPAEPATVVPDEANEAEFPTLDDLDLSNDEG